MLLGEILSTLTEAQAPFTSVAVDASRLDRAGGDDVDLRWRPLAQRLGELGAPPDTVEAIGRRVTSSTGRGGELSRVVVATDAGVGLDVLLPGRPVRDEVLHGPVPHLMPVLRALSGAFRYAVVRLDRSGADIDVVGPLGEAENSGEVEGGHDQLHKIGGGGWSQRRYQSRVEDSWEHNGAAVADELADLVRRHRPELVVVGGDEHALAELTRHLDGDALPLVVTVDGLSRAAGADGDAQEQAVTEALDTHRTTLRHRLLDEYAQEISRQQRAVEGLDSVVDALRRGQVRTLLLNDDPMSTLQLWAGDTPLQLGLTEQDSRDAGAQQPVQARADAVLAWALVGSDADAVLVDAEEAELTDGLAAVLRWSDRATAHDRVPTMPGHGEAPGASPNVE